MATEDVVIRLRVDDSELRRRADGLRGRNATVVPTSFDSSSAVAGAEAAAVGGLAGSQFRGSSISKPIIDTKLNLQELRNATQRAVALSKKMGIGTPEGIAAAVQREGFAKAMRSYDDSRSYWSYDEDGWRVEPQTVRGEVSYRQRNYDTFKAAETQKAVEEALKHRRLGDFVTSGGTSSFDLRPDLPVALPDTNVSRIGGIYGPVTPMYKKPGFVRKLGQPFGELINSESVALSNAFNNAASLRSFKTPAGKWNWGGAEAISLSKSVAPILSITALGALSDQLGNARSEYMKKVLVGGDLPDSSYVADTLGIELAKNVGSVLSKAGMIPLDFGLGAISIFNWAWESAFGGGADASNRNWLDWEINVDSTRQALRDAVGLNDQAYAEVERQQDLYFRAKQKATNAARDAAKKIGADIGMRLKGAGLNNMSIEELAEKFKGYNDIEGQLIRKAQAEFKASVVKPTKRDVNPYWDADVN